MQPSMFDVNLSPEDVPPLDGAVVRAPLSRGAWLDLRPRWLAGCDGLFECLTDSVPWRAERRRMYDRIVDVPRLVHYYAEGESLPHPTLSRAKAALDSYYRAELGAHFATTGLCLYRDGSDSVAWHGDRTGRGSTTDTMVAIVSLGAPRDLLLRPSTGGMSRRYTMQHGDLLVMGGSCQRTWQHAIPKRSHASGPRISVQFRPHGVF